MDYNKIISITGKPGLFELMSTRADGALVRSIEDNSTKFVSTRQHQFSHLDSIEVYTQKENVTLKEIFMAIKSAEAEVPAADADPKILKAFFEKVYPGLDFDRVFNSDLKKMIRWYHILEKNEVDYTAEPEESSAPKENKTRHPEPTHAKDMKRQQAAPRKIESRGVK